jgi:ADP-ribose pyrophosphatase YjhB (NUDIX family)
MNISWFVLLQIFSYVVDHKTSYILNDMKYCSQCGDPVSHIVPEGDNRPRYVCTSCKTIHYQNPKVVAGCLPFFEDKVLLCKRAIAPRKGYWTLPAGYLENGETTSQGALRETIEEANANVELLDLYTLFSLPHISQIYMFYRARLTDLDFSQARRPWKRDYFLNTRFRGTNWLSRSSPKPSNITFRTCRRTISQ